MIAGNIMIGRLGYESYNTGYALLFITNTGDSDTVHELVI